MAAELNGSKEDELSQQVSELKQLANADIKLLNERSEEDRRENSCEVSRLRCELRETIAQAQTNELDVNEKLAIQRNKLQVPKQHYTAPGISCCTESVRESVHKRVRDSVCA